MQHGNAGTAQGDNATSLIRISPHGPGEVGAGPQVSEALTLEFNIRSVSNMSKWKNLVGTTKSVSLLGTGKGGGLRSLLFVCLAALRIELGTGLASAILLSYSFWVLLKLPGDCAG